MADDNKLYGYAGKILRVNLSNGRVSTEPTLYYAKEWIGASGIAIKILYDELKSWVTPFEPANKLVFGAGALIGTTAPGACKSTMSTLGPVTGGWASGCSDSYVGGQLKCAGYDSIIIEGRSHIPVFLWIYDDKVEIREASHLWGKTTRDTLESVRMDLHDATLHIISIGPAGENLVRGACIIQDTGRAFGRCGTGAVMGSKNLKAIVVRGTGGIKVAKPKLFMEIVGRIREKFMKSQTIETFRKYGTLGSLESKQQTGALNYKNFQECYIPEEMAKAIDPRKMIEQYEVARQSFPGCVIGCGRYLHITKGPYAGLKAECPQMETLGTLQTRLAMWDPTFMVKAQALCNELGLDVDAAGGAIGWAMECYQRGIIDEKDTDGLKLNWGDENVALELIKRISYRKGLGNILAEGSAKAADIVGRDSSYYAMHNKGQDLYEVCRVAIGWILGTTTSTRGGGHTTGTPNESRLGKTMTDMEKVKQVYGIPNPDKPMEYENKAKMVMYTESLQRINNCFGVCHNNTAWRDIEYMGLPELAELYSAATGWETSAEDLKRMAMRQLNMEKAFNLRHTNFDRKDDLPTPRDMNEPIPTGPMVGWKLDKDKFSKLLDEYYDLHGWDKRTSFPLRETLEGFGLRNVANDLEKIGKLGKREPVN